MFEVFVRLYYIRPFSYYIYVEHVTTQTSLANFIDLQMILNEVFDLHVIEFMEYKDVVTQHQQKPFSFFGYEKINENRLLEWYLIE